VDTWLDIFQLIFMGSASSLDRCLGITRYWLYPITAVKPELVKVVTGLTWASTLLDVFHGGFRSAAHVGVFGLLLSAIVLVDETGCVAVGGVSSQTNEDNSKKWQWTWAMWLHRTLNGLWLISKVESRSTQKRLNVCQGYSAIIHCLSWKIYLNETFHPVPYDNIMTSKTLKSTTFYLPCLSALWQLGILFISFRGHLTSNSQVIELHKQSEMEVMSLLRESYLGTLSVEVRYPIRVLKIYCEQIIPWVPCS